MAVTKVGTGFLAYDTFERPFPTHGSGSIITFPGANLEIRGAVGARYLAAFPAQTTTYALISQGKATPDYMLESSVRNDTIEERSGIVFRGYVPGVDMFELRIEHDGTGAKNKILALYGPTSKGSGTIVRLSTAPYAWATGAFNVIRAVVKGNRIRAWAVSPGAMALEALIDYTAPWDLPDTLGVYGVAGGTFAPTGTSLNAWDYFKVYRANRYKVTNLPANHKIRVNGNVGPVAVSGTAYLELNGGPSDWNVDLDILDGADALVASYTAENLEPGDIFDSGVSVVPGGNLFFDGFNYNVGSVLGAPDWTPFTSIPELAGDWLVRSGIKGSRNNRVIQSPGPFGFTTARWTAATNGAADQDVLIRFRKIGSMGDVVRLRGNNTSSRGIVFGIEPALESNGLLSGNSYFGSPMSIGRTQTYRLYIKDQNSDLGPWLTRYSEYLTLFDGQFYFMRVRVIADKAYFRVWLASEEEPTAWDAQNTVGYNAAGWIELIPAFYLLTGGANELVIDSISAGLNGYEAENRDDLMTVPIAPVVSTIPGTQRLTIYEDDDRTPIIGLVDPRDGKILQATVSNHPEDPRPYLNPINEHSEITLALKEGTSSIGQLNFSLGDKRTNPLNQRTGWFTAILARGLLNHRIVLQQMTPAGDWETVIDGVGGPPTLRDNLVEYSGSIKSLQERERDVKVFTKTFFSVLPVGLPDGYGIVTKQSQELSLPAEAWFGDDFNDQPAMLLENHLSEDVLPVAYWQKHPLFAAGSMTISSMNRVYTNDPTGGAVYIVNTVLPSADYEVSASIFRRAGAASGHMGINIRIDPAANTRYSFRYNIGTSQFELLRVITGSATTIATKAYVLDQDVEYRIRIRAIGTSLKCYLDDGLIMDVTDGTITASGRGGIVGGIAAGTESTGIHLDNFRLNDLSAAVAQFSVQGGLLVKPVKPLTGKFAADPTATSRGFMEIRWKESGFTDAQWEEYCADRWDPLQKFNYGSSIYNPNTGQFQLRHQGVTIRWTDKWEEGKPVKWTYIRDMSLGDVELFISNQGPHAFYGYMGAFKLTHLNMQSDDRLLLPANGQTVFFEVISEREPTDEEPLMFTENIGRLAQRIMDGEFRDPGTPILPYDYSAIAKFIIDTPVSNIKITEPWQNMWEDMGQQLYKPFGYVPVTNGRGEVQPRSVDLPDPKDDLPVINDAMIAEARWVEGSEDLVTVAEFVYQRDFLAPQDDEKPQSDWERLKERDVRLVRIANSYALHKEHKVTYEQTTIRAVAGNNLAQGDIASEVGGIVGTDRIRKTVSRFSDGADRCLVMGRASHPVIMALRNADWVNLQCSWLPDKVTNIRGLDRIMQVIQLKTKDPLIRQILLVDAGPFNTPTPDATVGAVSQVGNRRLKVNVSALPTIEGRLAAFVAQYTLNPGTPNPDTTNAQWVTFTQDNKVGDKVTPTLPQSTRSFLRYRTEYPGRRPSKWQLIGSTQTVAELPLASGLNVTFPVDPTTVNANFTPGDAVVKNLIYIRFKDQEPELDVLVAELPAGVGPQTYLLTQLAPTLQYVFTIRSKDPTTGDIGAPVSTDFIASAVVATMKTPLLPTPFTRTVSTPLRMSGIFRRRVDASQINGIYGMAVFAEEYPSYIEYQVAIETGIGTGLYGAYVELCAPVLAVQGDWTLGVNNAPYDRLRRKMRARATRQGALPSPYTIEVIALPFTSMPLNALSQSLDVFYSKSGGLINGNAQVAGILEGDRFVLPVGVDKWALE